MDGREGADRGMGGHWTAFARAQVRPVTCSAVLALISCCVFVIGPPVDERSLPFEHPPNHVRIERPRAKVDVRVPLSHNEQDIKDRLADLQSALKGGAARRGTPQKFNISHLMAPDYHLPPTHELPRPKASFTPDGRFPAYPSAEYNTVCGSNQLEEYAKAMHDIIRGSGSSGCQGAAECGSYFGERAGGGERGGGSGGGGGDGSGEGPLMTKVLRVNGPHLPTEGIADFIVTAINAFTRAVIDGDGITLSWVSRHRTPSPPRTRRPQKPRPTPLAPRTG